MKIFAVLEYNNYYFNYNIDLKPSSNSFGLVTKLNVYSLVQKYIDIIWRLWLGIKITLFLVYI